MSSGGDDEVMADGRDGGGALTEERKVLYSEDGLNDKPSQLVLVLHLFEDVVELVDAESKVGDEFSEKFVD